MEEKKNPFFERLKAYQGKKATITFKSTKTVLTGRIRCMNFMTMNFVLEGDDDCDYIIRDDVCYIKIQEG
jgi:hypothetical protein